MIPFCPKELVSFSDDDCFGSRNFQLIPKPQLRCKFDSVNWPSGLTQACYVDVWADVHNALSKLTPINPFP